MDLLASLQQCSTENWLEILRESSETVEESSLDLVNVFLFYRFQEEVTVYVIDTVKESFGLFVEDEDRTGLDLIHRMKWHVLCQKSCFKALGDLVHEKVAEISENDFDEPAYPELKEWLDDSLVPYSKIVFAAENSLYLEHIRSASVEIFIRLRSEKLFEMITDFPDSSPALKELHVLINNHDNIGFVGKQFRAILSKRLLHLGASTSQILDFYVSMIKALRLIDPSDALLNYVAVPVRLYLKNRKDTIRCIITSLTESNDSDLHGELRHGGSLAYGVDEDDEEGGPGENWMPRKRNKDFSDTNVSSSKGLDILATLVSIYGSTELFISEYRNLLSDRMLRNVKYTTDQEVANLELLKIRFGEESLHSCEIMIKDVEDSKRANNGVHSSLTNKALRQAGGPTGKEKDVDFIIVSDNYWPSLNQDNMQLHPMLEEKIKQYSEEYSILKKPRKLNVLPQLGQVDLDLDFNDGSRRSFSVTPLQANVILFIGEAKDGVGVQDLYYKLEVDEEEIQQAVKYWVHKKVLREIIPEGEVDPIYSIIEEQAAFDADDLDISMEADNDAKYDALDTARQKAAHNLTESYILGLLKSHGSMSLDKLFSLLQLVLQAALTEGSGAGSAVTSKDLNFVSNASGLRQFLQSLSDNGKIDIVDGMYSLHSAS